MKGVKKVLIFAGIIVYLIFATVLFVNNLLPLKERLLLLGIFFTLNLLFIIGMLELKKAAAASSILLLILIIGVEATGSYLVWSSMRALDEVIVEKKRGPNKTVKEEPATVEENVEPFHMYLSGKDVYSYESKESRSDVNMILTINPKTHTILVTSIPRDSYMKIAGKGRNRYDKLTHAGMYGEEASEKTLENFFDIDISHYAVVNFTSVIRIIDALGGIEVENPISFYAEPFYFKKGTIELNGEETLRFARERYNLPAGEMERGRNHIRIIEALIKKAISPSIITNYPSLLKVVSEEMETNMPKDKIIDLVNHQISDNKKWTVKHAQLLGYNSMGLPSYQMPGQNLFMLVPSKECAKDIKKMMTAVMEGKEVKDELKAEYRPKNEDVADIPISNAMDYLTEYSQRRPTRDEYEEDNRREEERRRDNKKNTQEEENSWEANTWRGADQLKNQNTGSQEENTNNQENNKPGQEDRTGENDNGNEGQGENN